MFPVSGLVGSGGGGGGGGGGTVVNPPVTTGGGLTETEVRNIVTGYGYLTASALGGYVTSGQLTTALGGIQLAASPFVMGTSPDGGTTYDILPDEAGMNRVYVVYHPGDTAVTRNLRIGLAWDDSAEGWFGVFNASPNASLRLVADEQAFLFPGQAVLYDQAGSNLIPPGGYAWVHRTNGNNSGVSSIAGPTAAYRFRPGAP